MGEVTSPLNLDFSICHMEVLKRSDGGWSRADITGLPVHLIGVVGGIICAKMLCTMAVPRKRSEMIAVAITPSFRSNHHHIKKQQSSSQSRHPLETAEMGCLRKG